MARDSGNDVHGSSFHLTYAGLQEDNVASRHYLNLTTACLGALAAWSRINACSVHPRGDAQHGSAEWPPRSSCPDKDLPQAASSNYSSNIPLGPSGSGYVENLVRLQAEVAADDLLHDLGGAAEVP
jgi:hypothetical protein